ncbi:hypothetical protein C6499_19495 [Candidatus Poribacteria bacterium]|nr:MAG: hypothetical protein C6499_19495 [Candidatus Poribacteria bacterium]
MIEKTSYSRHVAEEQAESAAAAKRELVKNLLSKLKESDRTVITLYYFGEMTYAEIGEFLGVSADTVRIRVRRALQRLKKHELLIQEALGSFQLSPTLTESIMREIPRIKPLPPTGVKPPIVPWAIATSTIVLVVMMLGASNRYLAHFQQPYSFDATSEMTVELIDTPIVLNLTSKPAVRNQFGNSGIPGKRDSTGKKLEDILESHFNAIGGLTRLSKIRSLKRSGPAQLTQLGGRSMNSPGAVEVATVIGKKSYFKLDFGEFFNETTAWNGETVWKSNLSGSTTSLSEMESQRTKGEAYTDLLQPIYERHGSAAFQQGEDETFQGMECFVIQVRGVEDMSYYIDKDSNLLVGFKAPYTDPKLGSGVVTLHYADYTEYEGVVLSNSREIRIGNGVLTVNYTFTETEIDVALDETIFQKP